MGEKKNGESRWGPASRLLGLKKSAENGVAVSEEGRETSMCVCVVNSHQRGNRLRRRKWSAVSNATGKFRRAQRWHLVASRSGNQLQSNHQV